MIAFAQDEFRASASDVDDQERLAAKDGIGNDPAKRPVSLLFTGNDLHLKTGRPADGVKKFGLIGGVPRGAGRDHTYGRRRPLARLLSKPGHDTRRVGNGSRLQAACLVKAAAQPRLLASLQQWFDAPS